MSDPLAEMIQARLGAEWRCAPALAAAGRADWRERRPTREEGRARMPVAACCRSKDGFNEHDCYAPKAAAAICALFDRVWGEARGRSEERRVGKECRSRW